MSKTQVIAKPIKKERRIEPLPSRDPKYRVKENMSIRAKELLSRVKNRSRIAEPTGQHSLEEAIDETRKMRRIDVARKANENMKNINSLTKKLNQHGDRQPRPSTPSNTNG